MSRRTQAKKRVINPDPIYRSRLVSMMISRLLQDGKKSIASKVFYESLEKMTGKNTASSDSRAAQPPSKNKNSTAAEGSNLGLSGSGPSKSQGAKGDSTNGRGTDVLTSGSSGGEAAPNITKNTNSDTFKVFQQAVLNVTPLVEVKSRRVGGSNYQVPLEVNADRGTALALRWIVQAARLRPGREMSSKLANEFMDASNKTGAACRRREDAHKMAEANKAFANYRF